jgi:DNA polymerase III subunit epsilon
VTTSSLGQPVERQTANAAREAASRWASAIIARPDAIYLDTETTGFGPHAEIVEIALIDCDGRVLLDTLIRPDGRIPFDAFQVHGISDEMVAEAPRWAEICPLLEHLLNNRTVVVYNASFDFQMVNQANRRCGATPYPVPWQCAMLRYAEYAGQWNSKYGNYRWHKLDAALASFGQFRTGHRAAADALACRHVVHGMAAALPQG